MISTQDIDGIIGSDAVDQANDRIGKVGQVYLDSESDRPVWVSVKSGLFGTSETLVPLDGADWDSKALHLAFSKDRVKDAPRVEPDAELSPDEQDRLYDYYGIGQRDAADQGAAGQGAADQGFQDGTVAGGAAAGGAAAGDAGYGAQDTTMQGAADGAAPQDYSGTVSDDEATRGTAADDGGSNAGVLVDDGSAVTDTAAASGAAGAGYADADAMTDRDAGATTRTDGAAATRTGADTGTTDAGTADAGRSQGYDTSGPTTDDAMTRSEERLHVGTQTVQTGRARLRKYVVTEQQTVTVPVSHEEVRIEREPITDANRDAATDGSDLSDEEHEVVLTEERPVVEKETVPVERVRLATEQVTEDREVTEDVRHEEIATDGADAPAASDAATVQQAERTDR